ncbi:MAG TPA: DUF6159 family protein [Thermoplasmata archaeon]|nr:DUF6159 family protein [Thermoplasmata archaeon]
MPGTFSDSWRLTKTAFRMIREDRALLVFPLIGGLAALAIVVVFAVGEYFLAFRSVGPGANLNTVYLLGFLVFLPAYFALAFVSTYCTAALVGAATKKLNGQYATAADGWQIARARLGRLLGWALISATVGLVIQLISSRVRGVGGYIIGAVGGVAWGIVTYFIIPVLLFEDVRPWPALKRSARLYVNSFGRTMLSNLALGLIVGLSVAAAVVLGIVGFWLLLTGSFVLGIALVAVAFVVGVVVVLIGAAAEGVLQAALYRYATTGKIDPDLRPTLAQMRAPGGGDAAPLP